MGSVFSHELGHYFGLLHTHETARGIEVVERTNCLFTGDELCDTPADPRLSGLVNQSCEYVGNLRDINGDLYEPDPRNIMAYSRSKCQHVFTEDQFARVRFYYEREREEQLTCTPATTRNLDLSQAHLLNIFPNPGKSRINIEFDHTYTGPIVLTLVDLQGREVFQWNGYKEADLWKRSWEPSGLVSGMYTLILDMDGGQLIRKWAHQ